MNIRGTDFVTYPVRDFARAVTFYRDTLGLRLEVCSEPDGWAEFDCGNVTLALHAEASGLQPGTGARLALAVDDIDRAYAELAADPRIAPYPPSDYGVCRACEIRDPDGNALLLHHRTDGTFGRS